MATDLDEPGDADDAHEAHDYELVRPEDFLPTNPYPDDARRLGVDRWTGGEGALIGLAAALDGTKVSHRVVAWLLLAVVLVPVLASLWFLLR